jgi:L-lactate dehydrogenase (cytochrome)
MTNGAKAMPDDKIIRLLQRYPSISDLQKRARKRIPHIAWEYLDCGTGDEKGIARNLDRMAEILMVPRFMKGELKPDTSATLFGQTFNAPFGMAPVGLSGLMWPEAEKILAATAAKYRIPYSLSTVATRTPEVIGPIAGDMGWFQLYPPRERDLRNDMIKRARDSGFRALVVTADVPVPSRRERTARAGLRTPPRITPRFIYEAIKHPSWTYYTLKAGLPKLRSVEKYTDSKQLGNLATFVEQKIGRTLSWDYLKEVRDEWQGPLILKGVVHPSDAEKAIEIGVDGIQVSNHGARQFDAAPAAIDSLPVIARLVKGRAAVLYDSGVRSGLDILRALALGAEMVLLGRGFIYGVSALGKIGGDHVAEILMADLQVNMAQMGYASLKDIEPLF